MSNGPQKGGGQQKRPLYMQYPTGSCWDFTLSSEEQISGTVYCTDEFSETVVIQKPLVHTTLATEVRILSANAIVEATKAKPSEADGGSQDHQASFLFQPLPKIQKKALEERERRALRLAEESFRHINQKVRCVLANIIFFALTSELSFDEKNKCFVHLTYLPSCRVTDGCLL